MSASLVGSEMCIRDRPYIRRRLSRPPSAPPFRATGYAEACGNFSGAPGAVSYTHLTLPTICSV
eukprot:6733080-Alexandrium_andersonii.AAC.1